MREGKTIIFADYDMHVCSINILPHIHTGSQFLVKGSLVPAQIFFSLYNLFITCLLTCVSVPLHYSLWISAFVNLQSLSYWRPFHSSIQFTSSGLSVQQLLLCALALKEIIISCWVSGQLFSSSVNLSCIAATACSGHTPDDCAGPRCSPCRATCSVGRWWRFAPRWCTSASTRPAVCTGWAWCGRDRSSPVRRWRKSFCYSWTDVKPLTGCRMLLQQGLWPSSSHSALVYTALYLNRQTWLITTQGFWWA